MVINISFIFTGAITLADITDEDYNIINQYIENELNFTCRMQT
jgi:hypothetical protein